MRAIGVDIGGTFTDTVMIDDGETYAVKTDSTDDHLSGLVRGVEGVCDRSGVDPGTVESFCHGSTIAVNALIEGTGARTAVVATEGFRDVLEVGEGYRGADLLYAPCAGRDPPLVPRRRRYGVRERVAADGRVVEPLDLDDLDRVIDAVVESDAEAVAVCLLHAYRTADHEQQVERRFRERAPGVDVSVSSHVSPEIREYARTATTVADAYIKPEVSAYLDDLQSDLDDLGYDGPVAIMKSDGGLARPDIASRRPVTQVVSGPVAGVNAARFVAGQCGLEDVLTFDMGGTSCDTAVIADGEPVEEPHREVSGLKINGPFTKVRAVGAGGGSIARVDEVGALNVGPESAGADPGPACYGRGGEHPTVTDADLVLGVLNPETFAGGTMTLDREAARESIRAHVAEPMGVSVEAAALAVRDVVDTVMASAIRVVAVNDGHDPREFALVGFGGAGPAHACDVATALRMDRVVFPNRPGVLSAVGLLVSDIRHEYVRSLVRTVDRVDPDRVAGVVEELVARGRDDLASEGVSPADRAFRVSFDMLYEGQAHYLNVALDGRTVTPSTLATLSDRFERAHDEQFGFTDDRNPVELVNLRVTAVGATPDPASEPATTGTALPVSEARRGTRTVLVDEGDRVETPYYDGHALEPGHELTGPAIAELDTTTIWLPPGFTGRVDPYGNIVAERGGGSDA